MACGIFGCVYIYQILYKKQKIYVLEGISYFLIILGTLSLFLSAGTMHIMGDENEKLGIVQNIFTLQLFKNFSSSCFSSHINGSDFVKKIYQKMV